MGWRYGWSDGSLARALATLAIQVRIDQWPALLAAAQHAATAAGRARSPSAAGGACSGDARARDARARDAPEEASRAAHGAASGPGAARACLATPRSRSATLMMLRAMLATQPASVCLGILRREPALADGLPPRGYVELLQAVRSESTEEGAALTD